MASSVASTMMFGSVGDSFSLKGSSIKHKMGWWSPMSAKVGVNECLLPEDLSPSYSLSCCEAEKGETENQNEIMKLRIWIHGIGTPNYMIIRCDKYIVHQTDTYIEYYFCRDQEILERIQGGSRPVLEGCPRHFVATPKKIIEYF